MSSLVHQTEAHLLALAPHAGDHLVLTCFSPSDGLFSALLRPGRVAKTDASPTPDLFDRLALDLRHAKGAPASGPWFVREHRILSRHAGIGRDYATLSAASRLARVVTKNPVPEDSRAAIDALLTQAFSAFARPESRPDLVFFKSLYLFARDEGLPLKQHWLPALPPGDRAHVAAALALPSDAPEAPAASDLARVTKRLEAYLITEADLQIG
ncbi:MAG: hypothetical protein RLZZ50_321 [Verrucomicrobiota bacterium]